jgi:hypothetical protein
MEHFLFLTSSFYFEIAMGGGEWISTCKGHFLASMRGLFEKRKENKLGFIKGKKVVWSTSMRGVGGLQRGK